MRTITKRALIDRVAQVTGQRRTDVKQTMMACLEVMLEELAEGNRIEFREFGVFENRGRKGRRAQNPRTMERVDVPPRRTVRFKVGRQVRERLDQAAETRVANGLEPLPDVPGPVRRARTRRTDNTSVELKPQLKPQSKAKPMPEVAAESQALPKPGAKARPEQQPQLRLTSNGAL